MEFGFNAVPSVAISAFCISTEAACNSGDFRKILQRRKRGAGMA